MRLCLIFYFDDIIRANNFILWIIAIDLSIISIEASFFNIIPFKYRIN